MKVAMLVWGFDGWDGGIDFLKSFVQPMLSIKNIRLCCVFSESCINVSRVHELRIWLLENFPEVLQIYAESGIEGLKKSIKENDIDVLIPSNLNLGQDFSIPWVQYVYDFQHKYLPQLFSEQDRHARDVDFYNKVMPNRAVIVGAQSVKNDIYKFYPEAKCKVFVIPCSTTPQQSWLKNDDIDIDKYDLPDEYFLVSNQFWMHKAHITAIEAIYKLSKKGVRAYLVCTGNTNDYRNPDFFNLICNKIKEWGIEERILFLGFIPKNDQIKIMRKSIAVIQPTLFEGVPGGGISNHAIALDVPLILSDIPVNRELHENNITFFRAQNSDDLAAKMEDALSKSGRRITLSDEALIDRSRKRMEKMAEAIAKAIRYSTSDMCGGYAPKCNIAINVPKANMKKALITGITGQDGSYLAELLLSKGYEVHGLIRRHSMSCTDRINYLLEAENLKDRLFIHYGDLTDIGSLLSLITIVKPDEVYNLAAQSHVAVSFEMQDYTAEVTGLGVMRILAAIHASGLPCKFYQASTSELFGGIPGTVPQNERTPFYPKSPYGCAKLYAYWMTVNYREAYNLFACNGILFNHESPRRGENFVTRKITIAVAKIFLGLQDHLSLGNLEAKRDWGYAGDYVEGMWLMLQQNKPKDYVLASNETHTVREFVETAFREVKISIVWKGKGIDEKGYDVQTGKMLVDVDPNFFRPSEVELLLGDSSKAEKELGWRRKVDFNQLVAMMVRADIDKYSK